MIKRIIALLTALLIVFSLTACHDTRTWNEVTVTVIDKQYDAPYTSYTTMMTNGSIHLIPIHHSAEYTVVVKYDDHKGYFYDHLLYNTVEIGDKITVLMDDWGHFRQVPN